MTGCRGCASALQRRADNGYWARGCVTGDEKLLVVAGDGWAAIDLASGAIVKEADHALTMTVACSASTAKVYGVSSTIELPSGAVGPEEKMRPADEKVFFT